MKYIYLIISLIVLFISCIGLGINEYFVARPNEQSSDNSHEITKKKDELSQQQTNLSALQQQLSDKQEEQTQNLATYNTWKTNTYDPAKAAYDSLFSGVETGWIGSGLTGPLKVGKFAENQGELALGKYLLRSSTSPTTPRNNRNPVVIKAKSHTVQSGSNKGDWTNMGNNAYRVGFTIVKTPGESDYRLTRTSHYNKNNRKNYEYGATTAPQLRASRISTFGTFVSDLGRITQNLNTLKNTTGLTHPSIDTYRKDFPTTDSQVSMSSATGLSGVLGSGINPAGKSFEYIDPLQFKGYDTSLNQALQLQQSNLVPQSQIDDIQTNITNTQGNISSLQDQISQLKNSVNQASLNYSTALLNYKNFQSQRRLINNKNERRNYFRILRMRRRNLRRLLRTRNRLQRQLNRKNSQFIRTQIRTQFQRPSFLQPPPKQQTNRPLTPGPLTPGPQTSVPQTFTQQSQLVSEIPDQLFEEPRNPGRFLNM